MVFEKKQLSKVLAIALMVACAVAFMPLLNGQVFAAKKPGKAKITSLEQADTANDDGTYAVTVAYKAKKAKKYQVSYTDGTEAKTMKTKKKSVSFNGTVDSTYTVKVRGIKGKKKGKWSAAQEIKVEKKTPGPTGKMEVTSVTQSGTKQLKVTFGTAVDPASLTFTVTKDGKVVEATAKADPNDPNSVLLDLASVVTDGGAYSVAVKTADGTDVPTAAGAATDVKGEAEKVAAIEIDDNLVLTEKASSTTDSSGTVTQTKAKAAVTYVIKNQFGEDVTKKYDSEVTISTTIGVKDDAATTVGTFAVKDIADIQAIPGTKGTIVAVHTKTGVTATKEVTVGDLAKVSTIDIKGVYSTKTGQETAIIAGAKDKNANAVIAFEVKDQYDRVYKAKELAAVKAAITPNVIGSLTQIKGADEDGDNVADVIAPFDELDYFAVALDANSLRDAKAGEAQVIIVSNQTGAKGEYKFTVGDVNVIADLTVTAPEQVLYDADNIFTIDAKNGAGEAITDYAILAKSLTVGGKDITAAKADGWTLKKMTDGTAQLIYNPAYPADPASAVDTPASVVFQSKDTYKTSIPNFTIRAGKGIPVAVKDFTATSANDGTSTISKISFVDKFDNVIDSKTTDSIYAQGYAVKAELTNNANNKVKLYIESGDTETEVTPTNNAIPFDTAVAGGVVLVVKDITDAQGGSAIGAGKTATAAVTLSLLKPKAGGGYDAVSGSDFEKNVTVANDVADGDFDSYKVEVTSNSAVDKTADIEEIYVGEWKDNKWLYNGEEVEDVTVLPTYTVTAYGVVKGSETALAATVVEDTADLIAGNANTFTVNADLAKNGVTEDTITLQVPGNASAITKTIKFSTDAPKATSVIKPVAPKKYHEIYFEPVDDDAATGAISAAGVKMALQGHIADQYGFVLNETAFNALTPSVTLDSVVVDGDSLDPKDADDTVNYTNDYVGKNFLLVDYGAIQDYDDEAILTLNVTLGAFSETVAFSVQ